MSLKTVSDCEIITEDNSPDFSAAVPVTVRPEYKRLIVRLNTAKVRKRFVSGVIAAAAAIGLWFISRKAEVLAVPAAVFAAAAGFLIAGAVNFFTAAVKGETRVYRFDDARKYTDPVSDKKRCYIVIGGAAVRVTPEEYEKTVGPFYCAVIAYKKREFFCKYGQNLPDGKISPIK